MKKKRPPKNVLNFLRKAGQRGGLSVSAAKTRASRLNGLKGGRPKKSLNSPPDVFIKTAPAPTQPRVGPPYPAPEA